MIEIFFQRPAAGGSKAILCFRHPACERFRAGDVACVFKFPCMNAEISIACSEQLFQLAESERSVNRKRADNRETRALVNEPVKIRSS